MMDDPHFDELLTAYLENEISEDGLAELHRIVHTSGPAQRRFQEEVRLHVLMRETMVERVELQEIQGSVGPVADRGTGRWLRTVVASAAALLVVSGALFYVYFSSDVLSRQQIGVCIGVSERGNSSIRRGSKTLVLAAETPLMVGDQIVCDDGTQAMLRLSDGSILALEPGAELELVSDQPVIRLDMGEVMFEIAPRSQQDRVFRVVTDQSAVDVLGTVFSLVADQDTELKVYEGRVSFTRVHDQTTVQVGTQEVVSTAEEQLTVSAFSEPAPVRKTKLVSLQPTDDVTLDQRRVDTSDRLKVEAGRRTIYLRFDLPDVGPIQTARLRLTQDVDTGQGTLRVFLGEHSDWSERTISKGTAPESRRLVGRHRGVVRLGQVVEIDVADLNGATGPVTMILTLDQTDENDIWFASRESDFPPQLILECLAEQ